MTKTNKKRMAIILGSADGLCLAVSVIASLYRNQPSIWHAGLGDGLGELVGMFAALYLSGGDDKEGFFTSAACGVASLAGCVLPCIPFLFMTGPVAFSLAGIIAIASGAEIAMLRPEKSFWSIAIY